MVWIVCVCGMLGLLFCVVSGGSCVYTNPDGV
jgi:hypothetical protein